jgi:ribose/xylose/arabinose/galactoside ABC-type transport system permease subunit
MQKSIVNRVLFALLDNMAWLLCLISLIVFSLMSDRFFTPRTLLNIIPRVAALGLLVIGQSFTMLTAHFDLSAESALGLSAFIAALLIASPELGGWGTMLPAWQTVFIMLSVGILIGTINGFMVTKLKINNLVYTIAMLITIRGIPYLISDSTSASQLGDAFDWLGGGKLFTIISEGKPVGVQVSMVFMVLAFVAAHIITRYTQFGRNIYAVGSNREAAEAAGIRPDRVIFAVYIISGFCSALAGWVLAGRMDSATMKTGFGWIFFIQAAAIVGGVSLKGGRGNMIGAMGGVLLWGILDTGLFIMMASPWTIDAFRGGLLLLAVLLDALKGRYLHRRALREQMAKTTIGLADNSLGFETMKAKGS